jgi:hypothetical protein
MPKISLRPFRHAIAVLKRKGLLTGVDARSAKPNRRLNRIVSKYDDVVSGKATPVTLPKSEIKKRKALGDQVISPVSGRTGKQRKTLPQKVIIPHDATEKITVSHGKVITRRKTVGGGSISKKDLPIEYHNLEQYLEDLRNLKSDPNVWYCMKVYGDYTHCYRDIDLLLEEFAKYKTVQSAMHGRPKDQIDFYRHLQIVTVENPAQGETLRNDAMSKRRHKTSKQYSKSKYERRMAALRNGPAWRLDDYKGKQAARQRAYRARQKTS